MNKKKIIIMLIIFILVIGLVYANINKKNKEDDGKFKILTTFYPIYIMTLNITDGAQDVEVSNMAEQHTGCIHNYTLSTKDLKKFENADALVQNGEGLESFLDNIKSSYPKVKIVESAKNISKIIDDEDGKNAHVWLSIENYISQVKTISSELQKLNPKNKEIYEKNSGEYIEKLNDLKLDYEAIELSGKQAICLNEALVYLLDEIGLDITTIETDHEQASLSADTMKEIIDKMKKENIKMIFIDKDDDAKIAESLAKETGAMIYKLDSAMNGNLDKDAYIKAMKYNFNQLGRALLVDQKGRIA